MRGFLKSNFFPQTFEIFLQRRLAVINFFFIDNYWIKNGDVSFSSLACSHLIHDDSVFFQCEAKMNKVYAIRLKKIFCSNTSPTSFVGVNDRKEFRKRISLLEAQHKRIFYSIELLGQYKLAC